MKKVLFLIPKESMNDEERDYYTKLDPEIEFAFSDTDKIVETAKEKIRRGAEIVAGRGNTAFVIRQAIPSAQVIEIPITAYDIVRSLRQAKMRGKTVAVVTNHANIIGLDLFEEAFGVRFLRYLFTPFERLPEKIAEAVSLGAQIVLGGAITCKAAQRVGVPSLTIQLGPESMQRALGEIRQMREAIEIEAARQGFLNRLIDNMDEGVLSVGPDGCVLLSNAAAERILGLTRAEIVGKQLRPLFSSLGLVNFSPDQDETLDQLVTLGKSPVILRRIPNRMGGSARGSLLTLHETNQIQRMERIIRKEIYSKNHVAKYTFRDIVGESPEMKRTIETAKQFARTSSNILITGESGTGKEMLAQSIHSESTRGKGAFVAVNCAALPDNLLESELFGYVEGAFTGAKKGGKAGLFEIAHGGTIFLDEISEMDYGNQGALLRVIQEKYVVRLGSSRITPIDVRIICATNKDLRKLVEENKFRADLYYRLNVLNLFLPPLRRRDGDILLFMDRFLRELAPSAARYHFAPSAASLLTRYSWPGNVREARNLCERIVAVAPPSQITEETLTLLLCGDGPIPPQAAPEAKPPAPAVSSRRSLKDQIQEEELRRALRATGGNVGRAAELLGIGRSTLWRRMKRYGL